MRKEKQDRLKERVVNSKFMVDKTRSINENRKKQQDEFKRGLIEKKQKYEQDLARTLQRVYNKPLMFELSNKVEKFTMNRNLKEKIDNLIENERTNEENYYENESLIKNQTGKSNRDEELEEEINEE